VTLRVYPHVLDSSSDVVEWVRGTNLNRFFERLPADLHEPFVEAYRAALLRRIGDVAPYFYAFQADPHLGPPPLIPPPPPTLLPPPFASGFRRTGPPKSRRKRGFETQTGRGRGVGRGVGGAETGRVGLPGAR
jgi:hypothetical protein